MAQSQPLSPNEIRHRALSFAREWEGERREKAEAQTFWNEFFNVFGISRRRVAAFEEYIKPVKARLEQDDFFHKSSRSAGSGFIDLFWKGTLIAEHKSAGKDLDSAYKQALDYFDGLKERDLPRYVIVSDFARIRLYDLEADIKSEFPLQDLHKKIGLFGFISGYTTQRIHEQDPVNIKAAEQLGKLHDQLKAAGYEGHPLEVLLVRLLFCLFADDTGIFEKNQFKDYLDQRTLADGYDLGMHLEQLFQVLNTPHDKRLKTLDEQLAAFTYVNGRLFAETFRTAAFNTAMRETLLDACRLEWGAISPAIFGSLFQSTMDKEARRNLGAHYTREVNILKALRPLFLDALRAELGSLGRNSKRLLEFQKKLASIKILDPACGCGNFLVIAYRELRLLELQVLHELYVAGLSSKALDVKSLVFVDVDQFYGIEIEEFPAQIAQVALWLTDHQMNQRVSDEFGQYFARLPLVKSPNIVHGNALQIAWEDVVAPECLSYIVGNPPFVGKAYQTANQKADLESIFKSIKGAGVLDYVAAWYGKAVALMQANKNIEAAFVSTNSLTLGEQVGILWPALVQKGMNLSFAHRTFQWSSEARGRAAVHCVIIGFTLKQLQRRRLFDYETVRADPHEVEAKTINAYLVDAPMVFVAKRREPLGADTPPIAFGNMPNDGGYLLLSPEEKSTLLAKEPSAAKWIRRILGSEEFINGLERWCLWLVDAKPNDLRAMASVAERVSEVRRTRLASSRETTRHLANTPTLFGEVRQPRHRYIAVPEVSSESRRFIPIGFLEEAIVATNKLYTIDGGSMYHFGVITSTMHMAWNRAVGGRLKSDYQYSAGLVYNNFPWPEATDKQRETIASAAQRVLDARAEFPTSTLADLYDPISMPPELVKAHQTLDKVVDAAYGKKDFKSEAERVAFLFDLYQIYSTLLPGADKPKRARKRKIP